MLLRLACNWRQIEEGVALSGQGLRLPFRMLLEREGVRTVLNLRGANAGKAWYRGEVTDCEGLGIVRHDVALSARLLPRRRTLLALVDAFDRLEHPVLIKCAGGVDRSTFSATLYRLHLDGAGALERARVDVRRRRLYTPSSPEQRWINVFPDFYAETRGRRALNGWIGEVYSRAAFEDFLVARGLSGGWRVGNARVLEPAE